MEVEAVQDNGRLRLNALYLSLYAHTRAAPQQTQIENKISQTNPSLLFRNLTTLFTARAEDVESDEF